MPVSPSDPCSSSGLLLSTGQGGVVAESVPEQEYEETVNKARGMMAAVLRAEVNINEGREILRAAGEPGSWET